MDITTDYESVIGSSNLSVEAMKNLTAKLAYYWKFVAALIGALAVTVVPVVEAAADDGVISQGEAVQIAVTAVIAFSTAAGVYKVRNRPMPGALSHGEDLLFRDIRAKYGFTADPSLTHDE